MNKHGAKSKHIVKKSMHIASYMKTNINTRQLPLRKLILWKHDIEKWIIIPYDMHELQNAIIQLKNDKETGTDGIPGEIYKTIHKIITSFILQIMNNIAQGEPTPTQWAEGAIIIIHIRKKDDKKECANYRPIRLTQIIYKIWPKLQTNRLACILHIRTSNAQYGYKNGLSTIDAIAIIRIEHAIKTGLDNNISIVLMDLTKAFDSVSRTILWAALYKSGIPIKVTPHIMHGHQNTTLRCKDNGKYGAPVNNNVGVSQGSAPSAILFII